MNNNKYPLNFFLYETYLIYTTQLTEAVPIEAEEHSGQLEGDERRKIEMRFKDINDYLNVLVCTPTMELGIDIGVLSAIYMRNVPLILVIMLKEQDEREGRISHLSSQLFQFLKVKA